MQLRNATLNDTLLEGLLDAGHTATRIAVGNLVEAGSSQLLFGLERYLRSTELSRGPLEDDGYRLVRKGSGLRAVKPGHELNFATANGINLRDPAVFNAESSKSRQRACRINKGADQLTLDGMPADTKTVIHIVWSANRTQGLNGMHVGVLLSEGIGHVKWAELVEYYALDAATLPCVSLPGVGTGYADLNEPELVLRPRRIVTRHES